MTDDKNLSEDEKAIQESQETDPDVIKTSRKRINDLTDEDQVIAL